MRRITVLLYSTFLFALVGLSPLRAQNAWSEGIINREYARKHKIHSITIREARYFQETPKSPTPRFFRMYYNRAGCLAKMHRTNDLRDSTQSHTSFFYNTRYQLTKQWDFKHDTLRREKINAYAPDGKLIIEETNFVYIVRIRTGYTTHRWTNDSIRISHDIAREIIDTSYFYGGRLVYSKSNKASVRYFYNTQNQRIKIIRYDALGLSESEKRFFYDDRGNLVKIDNGVFEYIFEYDNDNLLRSEWCYNKLNRNVIQGGKYEYTFKE